MGSSPSTRGALVIIQGPLHIRGLIPVYAGSTGQSQCSDRAQPAHPRLRGEHISELSVHPVVAGSSPSTRGAPGGQRARYGRFRLIPVYAGSTTRAAGRFRCTSAHPRLRGEHFISAMGQRTPFGSSPSTRGALESWFLPMPRPLAHPRLRGEHFISE